MISADKPYTFDRVVRIIIALGFAAGLIWLLGYLSDVLVPFAVALLLAYLINPLVELIQKKVRSRPAAVFLSLFIVAAAGALVLAALIPMISGEVRQMGRLIATLAGDSELAARARERLPPNLWQTIRELTMNHEVREFLSKDDSIEMARTVFQKVVPGLMGFLSGAASFLAGLMGLAVIALYVVFLLFDFQKVKESWQSVIPPRYREPVVAFAVDFQRAMQRYFRAQAAVAAIVGALHAVGFAIIGLPLGVLLGLLVGLLNMVPYLQLLALLPAALLTVVHSLEIGQNIWLGLGLTALVFAVVQIIQDVVLVPKIMGKVTGLSPAMIMLSLSIWGKLLGLFGLLIALPMTCLLSAYYQRLLFKSDK